MREKLRRRQKIWGKVPGTEAGFGNESEGFAAKGNGWSELQVKRGELTEMNATDLSRLSRFCSAAANSAKSVRTSRGGETRTKAS